jgi:hypothetical protein
MGVNEKMDEALEKLDGLDGLSNALLKEEAAIPPSPDAPLAINIQRTYNETPDADAPLAIYIQRTYNETRGFRRVTLYEIKVFTNDREINTIARRFAEFQTLKKKIAGNSSALPIFPASRGIFGFFSRSSPQVIAQRQFQLEEWLQKACTHTNIRRSGQIRDFLFDWDAVERVVGKKAADQMKQGEGFTGTLNLSDKSITAEGCRTIAPALRTMTNLQRLNLSYNNIGDEGCRTIAPALRTMTNVICLSLCNNNIGDEGCRTIAPALRTMTNLKELYLSENNIGEEGCRTIAPALRTMTNLETLNLSDNNIGEEGCRTIAPALRAMTNLKTLALRNNNIGDDSIAVLCSRVLPEISLEYLYLDGNKIGNVGCQSLLELVNNGSLPSLSVLWLHNNPNISSGLKEVFKRDWKAKGKRPHCLDF